MEPRDGVAQTSSAIHPGTPLSRFTRAKAHSVLKDVNTHVINVPQSV